MTLIAPTLGLCVFRLTGYNCLELPRYCHFKASLGMKSHPQVKYSQDVSSHVSSCHGEHNLKSEDKIESFNLLSHRYPDVL